VYLSFFLFPSFGVDIKKHGHLWKGGISVLLVHGVSQTAQPPNPSNHQTLNSQKTKTKSQQPKDHHPQTEQNMKREKTWSCGTAKITHLDLRGVHFGCHLADRLLDF
jgi:hypothetical protein